MSETCKAFPELSSERRNQMHESPRGIWRSGGRGKWTPAFVWNDIELKNLTDENATIRDAYNQLQTSLVSKLAFRCARCTGNLQLDNHTTQPACQPGTISDLGNFTTIRLR